MILSSLFESRSHIGGGSLSEFDDFWYNIGGGTTSSGTKVNKQTAMRLYSVYACVSLIAETVAQLPLKLKRQLPDGGTVDATDLPLYHLLKNQPNPEMTSFTWRETTQGHILLDGNKYNFIERSRLGIIGIWPISPEEVKIKRVKSNNLNRLNGRQNKIVYEVRTANGKRTIPAKDMLHVVGFGSSGLKGESIIMNFARNTIGNGISLDEFEGNFFKNGIFTNLVLEHPETLGDNKSTFLEALTSRFTGRGNHVRPMVLENGMKANQLNISLADQQFLDMQKLNAVDICGVFKVPPFKIGIHGANTSFNNTEQQNKSFLDTTILQWLVRDEQAMNSKLLTQEERQSGLFIKYNFDALLRPDAKTRSEINWREWQMGVPLNDLLDRDDRNPVGNGDTSYIPLNMIPTDNAGFQAEKNDSSERNLCGCGVEHRNIKPVPPTVKEYRLKQERSIAGRTRILKRFEPLIIRAAEKLVNREAAEVKKEAVKNSKQRAKRDFSSFLDDFYDKWPNILRSEIGPVIRTYMEAQRDELVSEVGEEFTDAEFDKMVDSYIDGFSRQWVNSSRGQLVALDEDFEQIAKRSEEWTEKRASKVEIEQKHGAMNAVASFAFAAAGFGSIWALRGSETCPYCTSLEGKRVSSGEVFLNGGSEVSPGGGNMPMKVRNDTRYPPMHGGCDCFIIPG